MLVDADILIYLLVIQSFHDSSFPHTENANLPLFFHLTHSSPLILLHFLNSARLLLLCSPSLLQLASPVPPIFHLLPEVSPSSLEHLLDLQSRKRVNILLIQLQRDREVLARCQRRSFSAVRPESLRFLIPTYLRVQRGLGSLRGVGHVRDLNFDIVLELPVQAYFKKIGLPKERGVIHVHGVGGLLRLAQVQ